MKKNTNNPHDLTGAEIEFLRTTKVPEEVKGYLARQHENIGTKITAYRKVAAAARAECDAILATRDLVELHDQYATAEAARREAAALKEQNLALESTLSRKDAEILRLKTTPALAVHSVG